MTDKDYLEIGKALDIEDKKERRIFRFLEILPGALSLTTLISVVFLSWVRPSWVAVFIISFCLFWLCKLSYLSFHQIATYKKMKRYLKINWLARLSALHPTYSLKPKTWQDIYHLIILPFYKEDIEIIKSTCQALVNSNYPKEKMLVVLTGEERAGQKAYQTAQIIKNIYGKKFHCFLTTFHPASIKGEMAGKGSNVAWAVKEAKEKIIKPKNIPLENVIVSSFDIDTKVETQYFACLTWHYLTAKNPLKSSYQPIPIYNNNIWEAPCFSRLVATSNTFWQMMQQERPEQLVSYSSHSIPLRVLDEVGYPKNMVSDDSRIFWKSYLAYSSNYRTVPLYYPISMDTVMAETLKKTIINQYKQQRRWAWGCENIPYIIYGFLKNKRISLKKKIYHLLVILEGFWSWSCASLLIFSLGWLPLILGGERFKDTLLSYNLPRLTSGIMTIAAFGMLISAILSFLLLPPRPPHYSKWKNLSMVLQWILLPITLIIFGSLPALEAQVRLMLGKYMGFLPTEKVRKRRAVLTAPKFAFLNR